MSTYDAGSISAALTLDRSDFSKGLDQAKADADKFAGQTYAVKLTADNAAANKAFTDTQARADKFGKSSATLKLSVSNAAANSGLDDTLARLALLHDKDIRLSVSGGTEAAAETEALGAALKTAGDNGGGTSTALDALKSPMAALIAAGVVLSPILITVGTGLAGFAGAAYGIAQPIVAAATATGGLKANLAGLTVPQQQVAQGLLGLEGQFSSFSKALSPQVFSAFNSGLSIASTLLTDVQPVAAATGTALDGILKEVAGGLQDSEWKSFFQFMAQTAGPDIQLLGQTFGALADALPPLLEDLQPLAVQLLQVAAASAQVVGAVAQVTQTEEKFGTSVSHSSGFLGDLGHAASNAFNQLVPGAGVIGKVASAAGQLSKSSGDAAAAQQKLAVAQQQAQPSTVNLGDDMSVLGSDTATAALQTTALTDAWNILVGNFASKETAILNAQSAVKSFGQAVQQQGAGSLVAKQAFEAAVTSIGQMVDIENKAHAPASQMYTDLQNQIKALQASGPLNAEETQQLNGMQQAALAVANSTAGWTTQTKNASTAIQTALLPQLTALHANTPVVRTDINNLADSIVNTGTKSASTKADRAQLIKDLENAGVSAKTAQTFVNNLGTAVKNLPAGKALKITMQGDGSYNIVSTVDGKTYNISQGGENSPHATGGLITQGTHGTADDVPARLSRGEWVIKEASSSQYGYAAMDAVNRGAATIGYATGGQVGAATSGNLSPSYVNGMYSTFQSDMTTSMVSAMKASLNAAESAAKAAAAAAAASSGGGGGPSGPGSAGVARWASVILNALNLIGQSGSWLNTVERRMNQESGGNPTAVNLSDSNAAAGTPSVGLMQVIGPTFAANAGQFRSTGPFEYGVSVDPLANTYAGLHYAVGRYGSLSALNQAGGYARGTDGAAAGWALTGEEGPELVRFHGGETVLAAGLTSHVLSGTGSYPGYASGTPNVASLISGAPSGGWSAHVAHLQHVLKVIADSLGIKGLGKTDIANLKSEQVHDNASLKTSAADLKILATARDQITKTTEPALNKQISALNALAGVEKLSSAESSLLKTLKASLASQQAQLSKINVAINGKPAPAAPAATTTAASTGSSGTSTAASATASSGAFTGVLPSAPGLGAPNITGGGTGGLGGIGNATLGVSGFSSGVNASGYQITPSAGSGFQDWGHSSGGFDTSGIEALLQRILAVNQSAPAVTGSSFGASLNGLSRQAAVRSAYSTGAQL